MYLGAPDRCVRYEIGRLSSRVPNQVMRDPPMPPSSHASRAPVFMGVIGFPSENDRDHVGGSRRSERWSGWGRLYIICSHTCSTPGKVYPLTQQRSSNDREVCS